MTMEGLGVFRLWSKLEISSIKFQVGLLSGLLA